MVQIDKYRLIVQIDLPTITELSYARTGDQFKVEHGESPSDISRVATPRYKSAGDAFQGEKNREMPVAIVNSKGLPSK